MGDTEPGTSGIMGEPGQISASLTLRWRTGLVCPLFSETREPWGMWGRASRNGKVFLVSFAKQEKLWVEAGLPSLAHSFLQQLLIECLLWGRWCAGCWGYGGGQNGPSPWSYGACHMVQLHQREWRVGEAPCSLFSDTHSSGKIQPFWFLLHRLLWRGVIHSTSTYMNSLSLSQDSTSLTLLFAPVSSEILQTRLPSSLG